MVLRDCYWCEICIESPKVKCDNFENQKQLDEHYKLKHTVDELIDCINNMSNNPYQFDPEDPDND